MATSPVAIKVLGLHQENTGMSITYRDRQVVRSERRTETGFRRLRCTVSAHIGIAHPMASVFTFWILVCFDYMDNPMFLLHIKCALKVCPRIGHPSERACQLQVDRAGFGLSDRLAYYFK